MNPHSGLKVTLKDDQPKLSFKFLLDRVKYVLQLVTSILQRQYQLQLHRPVALKQKAGKWKSNVQMKMRRKVQSKAKKRQMKRKGISIILRFSLMISIYLFTIYMFTMYICLLLLKCPFCSQCTYMQCAILSIIAVKLLSLIASLRLLYPHKLLYVSE